MIRSVWLAGALALCACAPAPVVQPAPPVAQQPAPPQVNIRADGYDAAAENTCKANGGTYQIGGLLGRFYCMTPYADGGKTCTDSADCKGRCLAPAGAPMGQKTTGTCATTDSPFGCNAPVVKGEVGPVLCVD